MLKVSNLCLDVGSFSLKNISLNVNKGEYFVILGPIGSGKSLFIECLCGLIRPKSGKIEIDNKDVTHLSPRFRNIGYLPQEYALFPHLSVEENITFALRVMGLSSQRSRQKVSFLIEMLKLTNLLDRFPATLSGGERQKVALARALAPQPQLLLLDEPVSALDEPTRHYVCNEIKKVQKELSITTIHVCHNVEEAASVADRAGIFDQGKLIQVGSILELIRTPRTEFVARFFRSENIFEGTASPSNEGSIISFSGGKLFIPKCCKKTVKFVIRPESIKVVPNGVVKQNVIPAILKDVVDVGPYKCLEFYNRVKIIVYEMHGLGKCYQINKKYSLFFRPEAIHILDEND